MEHYQIQQIAGQKRPRDEVTTEHQVDNRNSPPASSSSTSTLLTQQIRPTRFQKITSFGRSAVQSVLTRVSYLIWGSRDQVEVAIVSIGPSKRRIIESPPSTRLPGSWPTYRPKIASVRSKMAAAAATAGANFIIDINDDDPTTINTQRSANYDILARAFEEIRQVDYAISNPPTRPPKKPYLSKELKDAAVHNQVEEAIDVSITMEDAPPLRVKKTVRFVDPYVSVLTGETVYLRPARKFNNEVEIDLPPIFSQHRKQDDNDDLDDSLYALTPERHYERLENQSREYEKGELAADNVNRLIDGVRKWAPNATARVEDSAKFVRSYFERVVNSLRQDKIQKEAEAEAERKRLEEERLRAEALEKERLEEERLAEEARLERERLAEQARLQAALEEQRARDARARVERAAKSLIIDLSPNLSKEVDKAMATSHPDTLLTPEPGLRLSRRDLGFILPQKNNRHDRRDAWLNDEVINLFLSKVCDKAHKVAGHEPNKDNAHRYFNFPSQFLSNIVKKGPASVARWGKRPGLNGEGIFNADLILIPCNLNGNHWTLLTIKPKERTLTYYDSFGGDGKREMAIVRRYLKDQLKDKYDEIAWKEEVGHTARQDNTSDCGVFTVFNALAIARGVEPSDVVTAAKMPAARRQMVSVLISGGFAGELDW